MKKINESSTETLVNHIKNGSAKRIAVAANNILKQKVMTAIKQKKTEIAKNLFNK